MKKVSKNEFINEIKVGDLVEVIKAYRKLDGNVFEVLELRGDHIRILEYIIHKADITKIYKKRIDGDYELYEVTND